MSRGIDFWCLEVAKTMLSHRTSRSQVWGWDLSDAVLYKKKSILCIFWWFSTFWPLRGARILFGRCEYAHSLRSEILHRSIKKNHPTFFENLEKKRNFSKKVEIFRDPTKSKTFDRKIEKYAKSQLFSKNFDFFQHFKKESDVFFYRSM
jgi:hypothetical protein